MAITDLVTLILSFIFLIRGAIRGFLRSLLVPFSIVVATVISVIYYQMTNEIVICLLIGLFGPMILHHFLRFFLKNFSKATNTEVKPSFLSRLGGSALTFCWGWVFIIFTLVLIAVLPAWGKVLTAVRNDVYRI